MLYKLVWFVQHATPINKWLIFTSIYIIIVIEILVEKLAD